MATDYANLVPRSVANEVIKSATEASAVLRYGRVRQMPAGTQSIPVNSVVPVAEFVGSNGGTKPIGAIEWTQNLITPQEIAVTIAVPDDFVADTTFDVWGEVVEDVGAALAQALDLAVLFGTNAPAGYPVGGITNALVPFDHDSGTTNDLHDAFNDALGAIEASGLMPTAILGDIAATKFVRGLRDSDGRPLYAAPTAGVTGELLGLPYSRTGNWNDTEDFDFIVGDWSKLLVGIRQDLRVEFSKHGVLRDGGGAIVVSAFQDDVTLMRAYMRVGVVAPKPQSRRPGGGATVPFAVVQGEPPEVVASGA